MKYLIVTRFFVSKNHAQRHHSDAFVYNGLDFEEYGEVDWHVSRKHLLFLAQLRKEKNLKGALEIVEEVRLNIAILGGEKPRRKWYQFPTRDNAFTIYHGSIGGALKNIYLNESIGLLFPVIWHEPFGLAVIESLYFGSPVIATAYGALPEIVSKEVGYLSNRKSDLIDAIKSINIFDRRRCHEYACDLFNADRMASDYEKYYEKVLNNEDINRSSPHSQLKRRPRLFDF